MAEARELAAHRGSSTESPSRSTREGPWQGGTAPSGASQLSSTDSPTAPVYTSSSRKRHWDLWEAWGFPGEEEPSWEAKSSGLMKGPLGEKGALISTPTPASGSLALPGHNPRVRTPGHADPPIPPQRPPGSSCTPARPWEAQGRGVGR